MNCGGLNIFNKLKQKILKLLIPKVLSPLRVMFEVKSTDLGYIKQIEKRGLYTQINHTFSLLNKLQLFQKQF